MELMYQGKKLEDYNFIVDMSDADIKAYNRNNISKKLTNDNYQPVNIEELRSKLFNTKHKDMSNLEFVENALKLREALMEKGEMDPFVPSGKKIHPTDDDFKKADKVAIVLQECVDYADGNAMVFTDELKRRIN